VDTKTAIGQAGDGHLGVELIDGFYDVPNSIAVRSMPPDVTHFIFGLVSASTGCLLTCAVPFLTTRWPFVATAGHARQELRTLLQRYAKSEATFVDVGSGDGAVLEVASSAGFGNCIGLEKNPILVLYSRWRLRKLSQVRVLWRSFEHCSVSKADLVYVYGGENLMPTLAKKFTEELRPGATIVCNTFPLPISQMHAGDVRLAFSTRQGPFFIYRALEAAP
jgi:hypothetical protein